MRALTVIRDEELVVGVNKEIFNDVGGRRRHLIYVDALPLALGDSIPWNRLHLGWHGGVAAIVGGSVVAGGSVDDISVVVFVVAGIFLVCVCVPVLRFQEVVFYSLDSDR